MTRLLTPARIVFGISISFFGLEYLLRGRFLSGLPPAPPWTPGAPALAYLLGAVLVVSGLGIALARKAAGWALLVATLFLLCAIFLHGLHLPDILRDGSIRTGAFEALSISGAAFVLAQRLHRPHPVTALHGRIFARSEVLGRVLFALSMLVFGEQHFQYVRFVAPLIPAWIPAHVFLTYFTGACFIAAGLAIGLNFLRPLAAALLGLMFLLWFLLLHLPRVVHQPHNVDELVSAVVALILSAGSFAIATSRKVVDEQP